MRATRLEGLVKERLGNEVMEEEEVVGARLGLKYQILLALSRKASPLVPRLFALNLGSGQDTTR